jgi:hypothetical protein
VLDQPVAVIAIEQELASARERHDNPPEDARRTGASRGGNARGSRDRCFDGIFGFNWTELGMLLEILDQCLGKDLSEGLGKLGWCDAFGRRTCVASFERVFLQVISLLQVISSELRAPHFWGYMHESGVP